MILAGVINMITYKIKHHTFFKNPVFMYDLSHIHIFKVDFYTAL